MSVRSDHQQRDTGSIAVEYVIVAPLFLLLFALIFAYARVGQLDGVLDAGTRDAARAVSEAPDLAQAQQVASDAVKAELSSDSGTGGCNAGNVSVKVVGVDPDTGSTSTQLKPGDTAIVTSTCAYSLSDLGLPVPLGSLTARSVFASVVDPNRSVG